MADLEQAERRRQVREKEALKEYQEQQYQQNHENHKTSFASEISGILPTLQELTRVWGARNSTPIGLRDVIAKLLGINRERVEDNRSTHSKPGKWFKVERENSNTLIIYLWQNSNWKQSQTGWYTQRINYGALRIHIGGVYTLEKWVFFDNPDALSNYKTMWKFQTIFIGSDVEALKDAISEAWAHNIFDNYAK